MNTQLINDLAGRISNYRRDHLNKIERFFQNLLLVSSSILGILVVLPVNISTLPRLRVLYLFALILLCISCLLNAIQLYALSNQSLKVAQELEAGRNKVLKGHSVDQSICIYVPIPKWILVFQKIVLLCFPVSLVLLASYSIIKAYL